MVVDSEKIAISRVNERVRNGGHGIPEEIIKKRFKIITYILFFFFFFIFFKITYITIFKN